MSASSSDNQSLPGHNFPDYAGCHRPRLLTYNAARRAEKGGKAQLQFIKQMAMAKHWENCVVRRAVPIWTRNRMGRRHRVHAGDRHREVLA
jgi:hypothetical protein